MEYLQNNTLPDEPKQIAQILFHSKYMVVVKDILYHLWFVISDKRTRQFFKQIVVPKTLQQEILKDIQCDKLFSTHTGVTKCFEALRQKYYWKTCFRISQNLFQNVMNANERKTR